MIDLPRWKARLVTGFCKTCSVLQAGVNLEHGAAFDVNTLAHRCLESCYELLVFQDKTQYFTRAYQGVGALP